MTTDRLVQLLADSAADIDAPHLAEAAWTRARSVRRRRRAISTGVVAGLAAGAVAVGVVGPLRGAPVAQPSPSGTPTAARLATVDRMPETLPKRPAVAPQPSAPPAPNAPALSTSGGPPGRGVVLYEANAPDNATTPEPVYLWRRPGEWVRLDTANLVYAQDAGGNRQNPLDETSLSPDGSHAAFAQPDELVVVDLSDGEVTRIPVPGFNEDVLWRDEPVVLVVQDGRTYEVDVNTRKVTQFNVSGWNLVAEYRRGSPPHPELVELAGPESLSVWSAGWTSRDMVPIDQAGIAPYGVSEWYGTGWRRGDLLVRAGWGHSANESGIEVLAVIDVRTGHVDRLLTLGPLGGRSKGCCEVIGWLTDTAVLIRNDPYGLAAWDISSGEVSEVGVPAGGVLSISRLVE